MAAVGRPDSDPKAAIPGDTINGSLGSTPAFRISCKNGGSCKRPGSVNSGLEEMVASKGLAERSGLAKLHCITKCRRSDFATGIATVRHRPLKSTVPGQELSGVLV